MSAAGSNAFTIQGLGTGRADASVAIFQSVKNNNKEERRGIRGTMKLPKGLHDKMKDDRVYYSKKTTTSFTIHVTAFKGQAGADAMVKPLEDKHQVKFKTFTENHQANPRWVDLDPLEGQGEQDLKALTLTESAVLLFEGEIDKAFKTVMDTPTATAQYTIEVPGEKTSLQLTEFYTPDKLFAKFTVQTPSRALQLLIFVLQPHTTRLMGITSPYRITHISKCISAKPTIEEQPLSTILKGMDASNYSKTSEVAWFTDVFAMVVHLLNDPFFSVGGSFKLDGFGVSTEEEMGQPDRDPDEGTSPFPTFVKVFLSQVRGGWVPRRTGPAEHRRRPAVVLFVAQLQRVAQATVHFKLVGDPKFMDKPFELTQELELRQAYAVLQHLVVEANAMYTLLLLQRVRRTRNGDFLRDFLAEKDWKQRAGRLFALFGMGTRAEFENPKITTRDLAIDVFGTMGDFMLRLIQTEGHRVLRPDKVSDRVELLAEELRRELEEEELKPQVSVPASMEFGEVALQEEVGGRRTVPHRGFDRDLEEGRYGVEARRQMNKDMQHRPTHRKLPSKTWWSDNFGTVWGDGTRPKDPKARMDVRESDLESGPTGGYRLTDGGRRAIGAGVFQRVNEKRKADKYGY